MLLSLLLSSSHCQSLQADTAVWPKSPCTAHLTLHLDANAPVPAFLLWNSSATPHNCHSLSSSASTASTKPEGQAVFQTSSVLNEAAYQKSKSHETCWLYGILIWWCFTWSRVILNFLPSRKWCLSFSGQEFRGRYLCHCSAPQPQVTSEALEENGDGQWP